MQRFSLAAGCVVLLALIISCAPNAPPFDILIVDGTVYDGSLQAPRVHNIGIIGAQIVSMSADADSRASLVINAHGKLVVPGFIDPHTHANERLADNATKANRNYLQQGVTTVFVGNDGKGLDDRDTFIATLEAQGIGPNVAFYSGHGGIRRAVMSMADRAPTNDELDAMRERVADDMKAGAIGLSSGLYYAPGSYSETSEVIELAKIAAAHGGVYDTHMRAEGSNGDGLQAAVAETIEIGRAANIPVHISHIKALGQDMWGQSAEIIGLVEAALASGVEISANQYPWSASGTRFSNALIPRWVMADSFAKMQERLFDPALANQIYEEMHANLQRRGGPEAMLVTAAESEFTGMTLAEIAAATDSTPLDAAISIVLRGDPSIASFVMHTDDIHRLAVQPWVMTGSDGDSGHPRLYATYPKGWQEFVVQHSLMSAEQFVHRSSGLVADTFGLCKRGYLREGYVADIAVIDAESFMPKASYEQPTEYSTGVDQLVVNGVLLIDGELKSALPGKILRKHACD